MFLSKVDREKYPDAERNTDMRCIKMNKDFRERMPRLEELAGKANSGPWQNIIGHPHQIITENESWPVADVESFNDAAFIAAANPAMIVEMIAELRRLEKETDRLKIELHDMDSSAREMWQDMRQQEKEADWLAKILAAGGHKEYWRNAARKAVSEADNACNAGSPRKAAPQAVHLDGLQEKPCNDKSGLELPDMVERLDQEADWLAARLEERDIADLCERRLDLHGLWDKADWRRAAQAQSMQASGGKTGAVKADEIRKSG